MSSKLTGRTLFAGRKVWLSGLVLGVVALAVANTPTSSANHPVYVEGNCNPFQLFVTPNTCGDYDGDGRVSAAEDADNTTDRIFGSINAATGFTIPPGTTAGDGGDLRATTAQENGRVLIVTTGRFSEGLDVTGGNLEIAAAPGVEANIDAVIQGDPDPNANVNRQNRPGIIIDSPGNRVVTLKNLTFRNWVVGARILGNSRVVMQNVRFDNNRNYGIHLLSGNSRLTAENLRITTTGFRLGTGVDNTPADGSAIRLEAGAVLNIADSYLMSNAGFAISKNAAATVPVSVRVLCADNAAPTNGTDAQCVVNF